MGVWEAVVVALALFFGLGRLGEQVRKGLREAARIHAGRDTVRVSEEDTGEAPSTAPVVRERPPARHA